MDKEVRALAQCRLLRHRLGGAGAGSGNDLDQAALWPTGPVRAVVAAAAAAAADDDDDDDDDDEDDGDDDDDDEDDGDDDDMMMMMMMFPPLSLLEDSVSHESWKMGFLLLLLVCGRRDYGQRLTQLSCDGKTTRVLKTVIRRVRKTGNVDYRRKAEAESCQYGDRAGLNLHPATEGGSLQAIPYL
ncbi:hypothetical protein STEG23_018380 [Scotinomys teguina]